jgi:hypothetical protein
VSWKQGRRAIHVCCFAVAVAFATSVVASDFRFDRETFTFANSTVWEYREGIGQVRKNDSARKERYTRRCFVMSRAAVQFHKFARFDPKGAPLDDKTLAARIRAISHKQPWHDPLPTDQRIVFPGYANLREMSKVRGRILQENIGLGWPTYGRIGNFRMFFIHNVKYQEKTHADLDTILSRGELFVAYLSDYPFLHINHSVLVYAKKPARPGGKIDHYICYDPNHPDAPRELKWSPDMRLFNYQKDEEFVGGYTRVYHVYGKPWQ